MPLILLLNIFNNIRYGAFHGLTQIVKSVGGNAGILLNTVDDIGVNTLLIDKGINGYSLGFKGVPKWLI